MATEKTNTANLELVNIVRSALKEGRYADLLWGGLNHLGSAAFIEIVAGSECEKWCSEVYKNYVELQRICNEQLPKKYSKRMWNLADDMYTAHNCAIDDAARDGFNAMGRCLLLVKEVSNGD